MAQKTQIRQHQPLRVPERWTGQERMFVIQIERLLDEIYMMLGDLDKRVKALETSGEEEEE